MCPCNLPPMSDQLTTLYVVTTMRDTVFLVTEEQTVNIEAEIKAGAKGIRIGKAIVLAHQVCEIMPFEAYYRNQRTKLAAKKMRMCRRCSMVVGMGERCPCQEETNREYRPLLEEARKENPKLDAAMKMIEQKVSMPQIDAPRSIQELPV